MEHASAVWDRHGRSQDDMDSALSWRIAQDHVHRELKQTPDVANSVLYEGGGYLGVTLQLLFGIGEDEAADELEVSSVTAAKVGCNANNCACLMVASE
jgi:hypothetical protein